jgi:hypothetical protein
LEGGFANLVQAVLFQGDSVEGLIINLRCQENVRWFHCLVEVFNLIELFAGAALFGWLTFSVMDEDNRKARGVSRQKLNTISDYFIVALMFFGIAAFADYAFSHATVFGRPYVAQAVTIGAFAVGMFMLVTPVVYWSLFQWRRASKVNVPSIPRFLAYCSMAFVVLAISWSLLASNPDARTFFLGPSIACLGGIVTKVYRDGKHKQQTAKHEWVWLIAIVLLFLAPMLVLVSAWLLGIPLLWFS